MYPRTRSGEEKYREKKRFMEINLILDHVTRCISAHKERQPRSMSILEFGSGAGLQALYLKKLGHVIGSDITLGSKRKYRLDEIDLVQCSITDTPFGDAQFDLIFSNHVLEHIGDLEKAFNEMKRIGKRDCIYAFAVPTNVWLLLSLPAQYYHKFRKLFFRQASMESHAGQRNHMSNPKRNLSKRSEMSQYLNRILPRGHGVIDSFWACYRAFRIEAWEHMFQANSFRIKEIIPLLLYGPSEWPIVPITTALNRRNICSSALFLAQQP